MNEEKVDLELTDLGVVSEDTHGGIFGSAWDGGMSYPVPLYRG